MRVSLKDDRGTSALFLAVLVVPIFALIGLVVDGGTALAARQRAMDVSAEAARAAGNMCSVASLSQGVCLLDEVWARTAAGDYMQKAAADGAKEGLTITMDPDGTKFGETEATVMVHVRVPTRVLGLLSISEIKVSHAQTVRTVTQ